MISNLFAQRKLMMLVLFLPLLDLKELIKVSSLNKLIRKIINTPDNSKHLTNWVMDQGYDEELLNYVIDGLEEKLKLDDLI